MSSIIIEILPLNKNSTLTRTNSCMLSAVHKPVTSRESLQVNAKSPIRSGHSAGNEGISHTEKQGLSGMGRTTCFRGNHKLNRYNVLSRHQVLKIIGLQEYLCNSSLNLYSFYQIFVKCSSTRSSVLVFGFDLTDILCFTHSNPEFQNELKFVQ